MAPITIMLVIINLTGNTKARRLTMSAKKKITVALAFLLVFDRRRQAIGGKRF